jgi:hypothetical protein
MLSGCPPVGNHKAMVRGFLNTATENSMSIFDGSYYSRITMSCAFAGAANPAFAISRFKVISWQMGIQIELCAFLDIFSKDHSVVRRYIGPRLAIIALAHSSEHANWLPASSQTRDQPLPLFLDQQHLFFLHGKEIAKAGGCIRSCLDHKISTNVSLGTGSKLSAAH